jgi:hypothetical protein
MNSRLSGFALYVALALTLTGCATLGPVNAPDTFHETAASPFFFSIGKQLKYEQSIDQNVPTLLNFTTMPDEGMEQVFPSPDHKKAVVMDAGTLYLAQPDQAPIPLLTGNWGYAGQFFTEAVQYDWFNRQWDADSRYLYVRQYPQHATREEQETGKDVMLLRLDTENPAAAPTVAIRDFSMFLHFFLVGKDNICFDHAPGNGDVLWLCTTPTGTFEANAFDAEGIHLENGSVLTEPVFMSYGEDTKSTEVRLSYHGFFFKYREVHDDTWVSELFNRSNPDKPLLQLYGGVGFKNNRVDGRLQWGSTVLPGGRYILLNCDFGKILIDGSTGAYRKLPADTRAYINLNSIRDAVLFHLLEDNGKDPWPKFRPLPDDVPSPFIMHKEREYP